MRAIPQRFFSRHVERVAPELLGHSVIRETPGGLIVGRIVEVEAYDGPGDVASHAHRSPRGRASIMFGPAGRAYVYFTYGMHHCLNVVAHAPESAGAILIRALEPLAGLPLMRRAGTPPALPDRLLASGPGRLCRAMDVDRTMNGCDLTVSGGPLRIVRAPAAHGAVVRTGPRIGLSADDGRAWRFWIDSPSLSRPGSAAGVSRRSREADTTS